MIEPKEIEIEGAKFILTKFPAIQGREIICKYPASALPKVGDYSVNEETMLKLMCFVGIPRDGGLAPLMLTNKELVDNHTKSWLILMKLEKEMLEYNGGFFLVGQVSTFFQDLAQKLPAWILKISKVFLELSSKREKPPSTS